jgi:hypothetical protein
MALGLIRDADGDVLGVTALEMETAGPGGTDNPLLDGRHSDEHERPGRKGGEGINAVNVLLGFEGRA